MTGRSGGAAMSWFTAAVDPRVKAVAPVMGISTYAANVRENTQRLHCDCMFTINFLRHDMLHQGALIAPRPLLMAHGKRDALFPVAGYEEFQDKVGALYRAYGRPDHFGNIVVDTAHQDSDYLREQAIRFFDRHLLKATDRKLDMGYTDAPEESLSVFGGNPPADAENYRIHETFTTHKPARYSSLSQWQARKAELMESLRTKVFNAPAGDFPVRTGMLRKPKDPVKLPALLYIASDGEDERAIESLLASTRARSRAVSMTVWPRGTGEVPWEKSFWKATLRNAMHVGRTVDSMRLDDVRKAVEQLRAEPGVDPERILLLGKGVAGVLGLYAAVLDPRVAQVMLIDPPESHAQGPIFLNVLRYTDLPEAAALLAPRRLNFYGRMPAAFEATRRIYGLEGKPDHVFVSMAIENVLEGRYHHNFASGY
jgi:dienelactone hydrolase